MNLKLSQLFLFFSAQFLLASFESIFDTSSATQDSSQVTFVSYNPKTDPDAPINNAVQAGNWRDGTPIFVGTGYWNNRSDQSYLPARIMPGGSNVAKPGAYMAIYKDNVFDDISPKYMKKNDRLKWVPANHLNATSTPNVVILQATAHFGYLFARVNVTNYRGTYTEVGRVHYDTFSDKQGVSGIFYTGVTGEENMKYGFEVLVLN